MILDDEDVGEAPPQSEPAPTPSFYLNVAGCLIITMALLIAIFSEPETRHLSRLAILGDPRPASEWASARIADLDFLLGCGLAVFLGSVALIIAAIERLRSSLRERK